MSKPGVCRIIWRPRVGGSAELPARTFYQRTVRMLSMFERQAQRRALQQDTPDAAWR